MKRKVIITFEIDATEYNKVKDTPKGVIGLVEEILLNQADWPLQSEKVLIRCGKDRKYLNL